MTDDPDDPDPRKTAFWCGLDLARDGLDAIRPNPYPARSVEWLDYREGYTAGWALGLKQRREAIKAAADLGIIPEGAVRDR